ncbi:bacillithiol system redox-active protein YtxJ [Altibacter sp.]|uniref:bacillithiol system redox-active protein YtxJ n=1 Tax=Altibacter sp. TaxID=2024823 RepID=UPI000C928F01|nr:bacillithiol system redox-active protein YtxJ [Altibacter sp.]MAP54072.1 bacillithiol system redox-active protein YtxJ [Altibacter sp.]
MGIFDRFKSQRDIVKEEIVEVPWHRLTDVDQLDTLEEESKEKPIVIFKHSTRCGISAMVLRQFESAYDLTEAEIKLYFLDLLQHRNISNEVASRFGVTHQSPQVLVIKNGNVVHHDSHHSISAAHLKEYI